MEFLREIIRTALVFFYNFTNDYGISIILLTITVRIITLPLSLKQIASTRAMQELGPERKKLEEKYKGDKETLNAKMMELYKERNVNPLAGCLPLLVQFPILIAMFGVLRDTPRLQEIIPNFNVFFLGLLDLTQFASLQVPETWIIPLLAGATTYIQTKQTTVDQPAGGMAAMTYLMPVMIIVFSFSMPAGLPLYWLAGNIFSIAQHKVVERFKTPTQGGAAQ